MVLQSDTKRLQTANGSSRDGSGDLVQPGAKLVLEGETD